MQVGFVLRGYLILNRIQIFYLFKETFSKALNIRFSVAPRLPSASPHLLFSLWIQCPKILGRPPLHPQEELGCLLFLLVFRLWLLHNHKKKSKKRREEKDQEKDQSIDYDPDFIQIHRMIILGEERSTPKKTISDWSWVDTHRGQTLAWLRKNLLSFKSRFKEKNYETGMWFDQIFNFSIKFSMCSILTY